MSLPSTEQTGSDAPRGPPRRTLSDVRMSQRLSMEEIGIDDDDYFFTPESSTNNESSQSSSTELDDTESGWDLSMAISSNIQRQARRVEDRVSKKISTKDNWVKGGEMEVQKRVEDFYLARSLRNKFGDGPPFNGFSLFRYLLDLKIDVDWAHDCAFRRKERKKVVSWNEHDRQKKLNEPENWSNLPWLTYTLILLSTIIMACEFGKNSWKMESLSANPMLGPSPKVLADMGALVALKITNDGQYHRLFTSLFVYSGLIQFFAGQLVLYFIVKPIERIYGTFLITVAFILTGVGANMACALFSPELVTVGPTCAIFGLMGFCLADIFNNWDLITKGLPGHENKHESPFSSDGKFPYLYACFILFVELATAIAIGLLPYTDNLADLGGFFYGLGLGMVLSRKETISSDFFGAIPQENKTRNMCWKIFWGLMTSTLFLINFIVLRHTDGLPNACPNCKYLSCIPFPFWKPDEEQWWNCDVCSTTTGRLIYENEKASSLEMICPYGDTIVLDKNDVSLTEDFEAMLPEYCEVYCDLGN